MSFEARHFHPYRNHLRTRNSICDWMPSKDAAIFAGPCRRAEGYKLVNLKELKSKALEARRLYKEREDQWDDLSVAGIVPDLADAVLELIEVNEKCAEEHYEELKKAYQELANTEGQLAIATKALNLVMECAQHSDKPQKRLELIYGISSQNLEKLEEKE